MLDRRLAAREAARRIEDGGKNITVVTSLLAAYTGLYSTYAGLLREQARSGPPGVAEWPLSADLRGSGQEPCCSRPDLTSARCPRGSETRRLTAGQALYCHELA